MGIWQNLQRCRRHRGHKRFLDLGGAYRRREVVDVAVNGGVANVFHRAGASEAVKLRGAGTALARCASGGARLGGIELGELLSLLAAEGPCAAAFLGLLLAQFKAFESQIDVGPPRT